MKEKNKEKAALSLAQKIAISKSVQIRPVNLENHLNIKAGRRANWAVGQLNRARGMTVSHRGRVTARGLEL